MTIKALIAACLLAASFTAPALALTVKHFQGETEISGTPTKVLVFDMAALDTLDALGVNVDGVPSAKMPDYLSRYSDAPKIGSLFEPDFEAVAAARPDLIIAGGRSSMKYEALAKIAPAIDLTIDRGRLIESAKHNVETLGRIFGKQEEAKARLDALDASIARLREKSARAGRVLVVLTTGGRMTAYGPGSRFGVIYDEYGFSPAAEKLDNANHGQAISNEFILETNPDWLFVVDRDAAIGQEGQAARQLLDNELVRKTTAWQKGQVVYLDPVPWYIISSGLTAMQAGVDQLSAALAK